MQTKRHFLSSPRFPGLPLLQAASRLPLRRPHQRVLQIQRAKISRLNPYQWNLQSQQVKGSRLSPHPLIMQTQQAKGACLSLIRLPLVLALVLACQSVLQQCLEHGSPGKCTKEKGISEKEQLEARIWSSSVTKRYKAAASIRCCMSCSGDLISGGLITF